jgi:hypothetical protein
LAAGFATAYISVRSVVAGARDIIELGSELEHLKARTGESASRMLVFGRRWPTSAWTRRRASRRSTRLTQKVRNAIGKTSIQANILSQLGLDPEKLNAMGKLDRFEAVAEALRNTSDEEPPHAGRDGVCSTARRASFCPDWQTPPRWPTPRFPSATWAKSWTA